MKQGKGAGLCVEGGFPLTTWLNDNGSPREGWCEQRSEA